MWAGGQIRLRPFAFGQDDGCRHQRGMAHCLGKCPAMLARLQAFEAARPERPAGFRADLVDAANQPRVTGSRQLRAMPTGHPHEAAAVEIVRDMGGNVPHPIFGKKGDIAVMRAETAGAAGRAVNL